VLIGPTERGRDEVRAEHPARCAKAPGAIISPVTTPTKIVVLSFSISYFFVILKEPYGILNAHSHD
jgi:hypothetical protein